MIDRVDHVAVIVRDIDAALPYYVDRLGLRVVGDEAVPAAGVRVAYLDAGNTMLQLVQPTAPGSLQDFVATQGEGLHHVCFAVSDIGRAVEALAPDAGVKVVMGGRDRRACFLPRGPNGLQIELTETEPSRAGQEEATT